MLCNMYIVDYSFYFVIMERWVIHNRSRIKQRNSAIVYRCLIAAVVNTAIGTVIYRQGELCPVKIGDWRRDTGPGGMPFSDRSRVAACNPTPQGAAVIVRAEPELLAQPRLPP